MAIPNPAKELVLVKHRGRFEDRFWACASVEGECLVWKRARLPQGYGIFQVGRKQFQAHRVAYFIAHGFVPLGKIVCHHCDNPSCIKPEHLFAGTYKANTQDAVSKNRMASGRRNGAYTKPEMVRAGESNGRSVLTNQQVRDIRLRFATTDVSKRDLGREFLVSEVTIHGVITKSLWRHVT